MSHCNQIMGGVDWGMLHEEIHYYHSQDLGRAHLLFIPIFLARKLPLQDTNLFLFIVRSGILDHNFQWRVGIQRSVFKDIGTIFAQCIVLHLI